MIGPLTRHIKGRVYDRPSHTPHQGPARLRVAESSPAPPLSVHTTAHLDGLACVIRVIIVIIMQFCWVNEGLKRG